METQEKATLFPHRPRSGRKVVLVIHGGAGTMSRATSTPEKQALYKTALKTALEAGYAVLREGGEAMDAAVAAVTVMEGGCSCWRGQGSFTTGLAQIVLSSTREREPSSTPLERCGLLPCRVQSDCLSDRRTNSSLQSCYQNRQRRTLTSHPRGGDSH